MVAIDVEISTAFEDSIDCVARMMRYSVNILVVKMLISEETKPLFEEGSGIFGSDQADNRCC